MSELQKIEAENKRLLKILNSHGIYEIDGAGNIITETKTENIKPTKREIREAFKAFPLLSEWVREIAKTRNTETKLFYYKAIKDKLLEELERFEDPLRRNREWLQSYDAIRAAYDKFLKNESKLSEARRAMLWERFRWLFENLNFNYNLFACEVAQVEKTLPLLKKFESYIEHFIKNQFTEEELKKYAAGAELMRHFL